MTGQFSSAELTVICSELTGFEITLLTVLIRKFVGLYMSFKSVMKAVKFLRKVSECLSDYNPAVFSCVNSSCRLHVFCLKFI